MRLETILGTGDVYVYEFTKDSQADGIDDPINQQNSPFSLPETAHWQRRGIKFSGQKRTVTLNVTLTKAESDISDGTAGLHSPAFWSGASGDEVTSINDKIRWLQYFMYSAKSDTSYKLFAAGKPWFWGPYQKDELGIGTKITNIESKTAIKNTSTGTASETIDDTTNTKIAQKFTAHGDIKLTDATMYQTSTGNLNGSFAIYTHDSGSNEPNAKVGGLSSENATLNAGSPTTLNFTSPTTLTAGETYWLVFVCNSGSHTFEGEINSANNVKYWDDGASTWNGSSLDNLYYNLLDSYLLVTLNAKHDLYENMKILIKFVEGMTELNGNTYYVKETGDDDTFILMDSLNTGTPSYVDGSGYSAWTNEGRIFSGVDVDLAKLNISFKGDNVNHVTVLMEFDCMKNFL